MVGRGWALVAFLRGEGFEDATEGCGLHGGAGRGVWVVVWGLIALDVGLGRGRGI